MKKQAVKSKKPERDSRKEAFAGICVNANCKLRKAGCKGFEACPGYKGRG